MMNKQRNKFKNENISIHWDAHVCPPLKVGGDLSFLQRYKNSGVNFISLNVGFDLTTKNETISLINYFHNWIDAHKEEYILAKKTEDILYASQNNKLCIGFDIEGANVLDGDLEMIIGFYNLGVRQFVFAYNKNTIYGGGCIDEDHGLTPLGKKLIKQCNETGMVIDCSHVGFKTSMEIIDLSTSPVVFSHSNPLSLINHPRNITDEQILFCANKGGVIGINGISLFLGNCKTETIVEHIDYIVQKTGPDHVGLGLDCAFDLEEINDFIKMNPDSFPSDITSIGTALAQPEQFPEVENALRDKGYPQDTINKIMGKNFLRIAETVWK